MDARRLLDRLLKRMAGRRTRRPPWVRYGLAALAVAIALDVYLIVSHVGGAMPGWGLFYLAAIAATVVGGRGPGFVALALGTLAGWYVVALHDAVAGGGDAAETLLYLGVGGAMVAIVSSLETMRARSLETEKRYATLVEHMPDVVFRLDRDLRHLYVSPAVTRVSRVPPERILGRSARELGLPARVADAVESACREALATRREVVIEWSSGLRDFRTRLVPEGEGTGDPATVLGITEDVTDRVRIDRALHETDERLRGALEQIGVVTDRMAAAVTRCSRDLRYLWASRRYAEWIGIPAEAVVGRPIVEVVGPEAFATLRPYFARVLAGETVEYEEEATFQAIGRRWISATYVPTVDAGGAVDGWVAVVTDITHRKALELAVERARSEAEARLRESGMLMTVQRALSQSLRMEDVLATLCRAARDLVAADGATFVLREDDCVRYVCENAVESLWKGRRFPIERCISGWAILAREAAVVDDVYADPRIPFEAYRETFVRSLAMAPVRRADPLGAIGVYWAAPHRATADEVRLLEGLADLAAIAVENARLFEEVEQANRAKDEFLAMLSHELRNPLAPIVNAVGVLRAERASPPAIEHAKGIIDRQVRHLARLVDDLLEVARITRGRIALQKAVVSLREVIVEAAEVTRAQIDQQEHTLSLAVSGDVAVDADRARLVQVFANLLTNAAKFTPPGGQITVESAREVGRVTVRVRDTGIGIPKGLQAKIFDLFAQGETTLARSQGGLGIGLTLAKRLVELHGGALEVESSGPDQGSTFTVSLPARTFEGTRTTPSRPEPKRATAARLRVLIVEDHVDSAESLRMVVTLLGDHDVRVVHDGEAALRTLAEFVPDVAFLDIGLPGLTGYELARALRADARADRTRLVALTGYGRDEDKARAREVGFERHLTKPVEVDRLAAVLLDLAPTLPGAPDPAR